MEEIAGEISQSVANTSQHLQVLARAGLVRSRREGTRIFYRLASERVGDLWAAVRDVAVRHVAEVGVLADEYLGERDGVEQLSAVELEKRLARGDVVVLDVRPEIEYRAGHIAGSRSAPLPALEELAQKLPRRREIVAYCRGPYCVYADDAVRLLRERGLNARRLDVGFRSGDARGCRSRWPAEKREMLLRPFLNDAGSCASYLFGCTSHGKLAVVDAHVDLVDDYLAAARAVGSPIVAVFETHVQADHVSGLPALVERTGATAYLPAGAGVEFEHVALADREVVELGNTSVTAVATPGHAPAHHAYTVTDRRRGEEPWLVFSGDSLLIGDVGRPDLHVAGDAARAGTAAAREFAPAARAARRCRPLPEPLRRLGLRPRSLRQSLLLGRLRAGSQPSPRTRRSRTLSPSRSRDMPPRPVEQERIVAANRSGTVAAPA